MSSHSNWNSSFLSDPNPEITTELAVGMTLGKYLLTEEIGRGGVGIVYQALHQTLNIPVAVKVLRPDKLADDPDILEQFRVEARLLAQLNHPNLVRVWDFEDDPQMPYLVLEYVGGSNLLDLTLQCGGLGVAKALRFCIQVADGLG